MNKLIKTGLVLLGLIGWNSALIGQSISVPSGEPEKTEASDIKPLNNKGSTFNEVWAYHIYLEDGTQLYVSFMLANFGTFMSPVSGARLSAINFDGEYYQVAREYPLREMDYDDEQYKLQLHPNRDIWFEGQLPESHRLRFRTTKDGIRYDIDLRFKNIQAGKRWGDGWFKVDRETIYIQSLIPYAEVVGKVSIAGTEKSVKGTAYMDHTYQSTITPRVLTSGYRYIFHGSGGKDWEIGYFLIPEDKSETNNIIGYGLKSLNGEIQLRQPEKIELGSRVDFKNGRVPGQLSVAYNPNGISKVSVIEGLERLSFLSELSGLRLRIARSYLRGEVFEYRGLGKLNEEKQVFLNYFRVE